MSELSRILGNEGAPHTFTHKGKTHSLRYIDQDMRTAFEKDLFARARERAPQIIDLQKYATPAAREEALAAYMRQLNDNYVAGDYTFESKLGRQFCCNAAGQIWLVREIFGCADDREAMTLLVERKAEVVPLMELVLRESVPQAPKSADPNAPAPAA